jgi:hypothetical protein
LFIARSLKPHEEQRRKYLETKGSRQATNLSPVAMSPVPSLVPVIIVMLVSPMMFIIVAWMIIMIGVVIIMPVRGIVISWAIGKRIKDYSRSDPHRESWPKRVVVSLCRSDW